jgi:hypothetical protein
MVEGVAVETQIMGEAVDGNQETRTQPKKQRRKTKRGGKKSRMGRDLREALNRAMDQRDNKGYKGVNATRGFMRAAPQPWCIRGISLKVYMWETHQAARSEFIR